MILERKNHLNYKNMKEAIENGHDNIPGGIMSQMENFVELAGLMQIYRSAMKEVSTKLEILDDEFHTYHSFNPIHHMECRLKGVRSIENKMSKNEIPVTLENVRNTILDIAGIRVICNYIDDIYLMEKLLLGQSDVKLLKRKDYIANPKQNGYRSLHIIVEIPIFLSTKTEYVPVEIQMRTAAMDYWASLEHSLRYKNSKKVTEEYSSMLLDCANVLADTDVKMQKIQNAIIGENTLEDANE